MDRGTEEERQRVRTDFSLAIGDIWCGGGRRVRNSVFTDLQEAEEELKDDTEMNFFSNGTLWMPMKPIFSLRTGKMVIDTTFLSSIQQLYMWMSIEYWTMAQRLMSLGKRT